MRLSAITLRHKGFTLIEMLIVIVVIAILALIVIPHVVGASRKAQESSLKHNLQEVRQAIEQFQADTATYPNSLADLVAAQTAAPTTGEDGLGGTGVGIPSGCYKGPYFDPQGGLDNSGVPMNPFAASPTGTLSSDLTAAWNYSQGIVHCAIPTSGNTLDGIPYQEL